MSKIKIRPIKSKVKILSETGKKEESLEQEVRDFDLNLDFKTSFFSPNVLSSGQVQEKFEDIQEKKRQEDNRQRAVSYEVTRASSQTNEERMKKYDPSLQNTEIERTQSFSNLENKRQTFIGREDKQTFAHRNIIDDDSLERHYQKPGEKRERRRMDMM